MKVAVIGSGNIGTDLMVKVIRGSRTLELAAMVGIDATSGGLTRAARMGVPTTHEGVEGLIAIDGFADIGIVFDATSARAHEHNARVLAPYGKRLVDLTPAALDAVREAQAQRQPHRDRADPLRPNQHRRRIGSRRGARRARRSPGGRRRRPGLSAMTGTASARWFPSDWFPSDRSRQVIPPGRPPCDVVPVLPETPATAAALSVADRHFSPAFHNHSVRTYLWGAAYATAHGIAYDDELYCVAALLHDIALAPAFDSHTVPFEEAGGEVARVFGLAAGWPAGRADRVAEIIVLHMRDDVPADADPEAHLLQVASSWDVVGRRPEEFPPDARAAMLDRYPWLGFGAEFLAHFEDQARRKPGSAAAASVGRDLAGRMAAQPLDGEPAATRAARPGASPA